MKTFLLLLFAAFSISVQAQSETNSASAGTNEVISAAAIEGAVAATPSATNQIDIVSDYAELQTETNYTVVYTGNVKATYGEANLTCEVLTIRAEKGADRPDYMFADRNVVINHKDKEGNPIHATGDKAIYTYKVENSVTNELIMLSGDAKIDRPSGLINGDVITWNLITGIINWNRNRTVIDVGTNASSKLNFGSSRTNKP